MPKELLWNDAAFKRRVRAAVKRKGMTLVDALTTAGASREYLNKSVEDRGINTALNLAQLLDVPAAELLGISIETDIAREQAREREREQERERRLFVVARMMATQLVTLVCIAGKNEDVDPAVLMELVLREIAAHGGGKGR